MHSKFHPKSNVEWLCLSRSEGGVGFIEVQDTVETTILRLTNYVRNSNKKLLVATRTIEENEIEKHQMSTKWRKRMKGKHSGHKNNYLDNLSGKQRVK